MDAQGSRPDADLIGESLSRPDAFAAIFERHFAAVHRYLARRAGAGLADDLASEVFTVAFARRASFRGHSDSALPWLLGIATNLLHNHGRAERSAWNLAARLRASWTEEQPDIAERAAVRDERGGRAGDVAAGLAALSAEQREVVLLFAWAELSYEEIAEALAIPLGTVRSRLARARVQLRAGLVAAATGAAREENR